METVLAGIIIIFVIFFAMMTLTEAFLTTQEDVQVSWQEMEARWGAHARTDLMPIDAYSSDSGTVMTFVLQNVGPAKLADFDQWDVITQYYDNGTNFHIGWLPYIESSPINNEWTMAGLYMNAADEVAEAYDPGLLNPGEEIIVELLVAPPVGAGGMAQMTIAVPNGISVSTVFTGNYPPELVTNTGLIVASGGTGLIDASQLETTDIDDLPVDLTYTVTVGPAQGTLNLEDVYTQDDIDNGLLSYTHTGSGDDSFQFEVSDGKDPIGAYVFNISVSEAPVLMTNAGLALSSGGTGVIDSLVLVTTDVDNLPSELIYTVTSVPTAGTLNLGDTFTQQDIDSSLLNYTHLSSGNDFFVFTITDGTTIIGTYTFIITIS